MSPLLFVVLCGLLAGLLLYVVVIGLGALGNLALDRTRGQKAVKRQYLANDEVRAAVAESKAHPEDVKPRPKRVAPEQAEEPVLAEAPSAEMAVASATPVIEAPAEAAPVVEKPKKATRRPERSFPKRAESAPAEQEPAPQEVAAPSAEAEPAAVPAEVKPERTRRIPKPSFPTRKEAPAAATQQEAQPVAEPGSEPEAKPEAVDPFADVLAALNRR